VKTPGEEGGGRFVYSVGCADVVAIAKNGRKTPRGRDGRSIFFMVVVKMKGR
jgi:hypothetical protein